MESIIPDGHPSYTAYGGGSGHVTTSPGPTRLRLFGGWQLTDHSTGTPVSVTANAQRLLSLLALTGPQPRAVVAGTLWPEATESHAHGCLRTTLWRLHRCQPRRLIDVRGETLVLATGITVDVHEFLAWADMVSREDVFPPTRLLPGPSSGFAELLPGWYDDWVLVERERLRHLRLYALEALAERLLSLNRYGEALMATLEAIALEPLRESAHRMAIRIHLADGNTAEALNHFHTYRRLIRRELDLLPSERMLRLVEHLNRSRTPRDHGNDHAHAP